MYRTRNAYYSTPHQGRNDSKFEAGYAQELALRVKAHDIKSFEEQVVLDLIYNGFLVCTYKIDFIIHHNDGTLEYVETKGWPSPLWRLKWKVFESLYSDRPGVRLTVIYQQSDRFKVPKARRIKPPISY